MKGTNMNLFFGLEVIYEDTDSRIDAHDKAGIVGVNDAGKTTLFRILMHEQELDSDTVPTNHLRIGYPPQKIILENGSCTVFEYLQSGWPIRKLENELNQIYQQLKSADPSERTQLFKQMGKLQSRLESLDYYEVDSILLHAIDRMQIDTDLLGMPLDNLSGGQKLQIASAYILHAKFDILFLDEPTNRSNVAAKEFVTGFLKNYKGTVLIISRGISFLNQIINKIPFIGKAAHKISVYNGSYDTYRQKCAQKQCLRGQVIVQEEKEILELEEFVRRADQASRTNHTFRRMGQERTLHLEKRRRAKQTRDRTYKRIKTDIHSLREYAVILLETERLSFHYPNQPPPYRDLSFQIDGKERFLVVRENGAEKSALLKLIMGILSPDVGNIHFRPKADVACYVQGLEQPGLQKTVLENAWTNGYSVRQFRSALSNFFFYVDDIHKRTEVSPPGEKTRVALCKVLLQRAGFLVLDEPTNRLDSETQSIIGGNFHLFEGTVMAVSHNPWFVEWPGINRILILPSGRIVDYSRELLEYYYGLNPEEEL